MLIHDLDWRPAPVAPQLNGAEIHLWRVALDQPPSRIAALFALLSTDERHKAARFRHERDRQRYISGRALLRSILGRYLNLSPERMMFVYGPHSKPALGDSCLNSKLRFNLSHAEDLALYAIAYDRELGVDLEYINPQLDVARLARRGLSAYEQALARSLPADQQVEYFVRCWTRKEAFVKACGSGLSRQLDQLELPPALHTAVTFCDPAQPAAQPWTILEFTPAAQAVAALVVAGTACDIRCWDWTADDLPA